ncbi:MAG TPA: HEPN domain-containing protein [Candidatus Hydrogenedentes bacterium]|nr:HEPN domain-containing protein [Candidatus Hydrogenedentota bacterium]HPG65969.1 HEPN domain-containing protein [Candidatus Hydrogenedentota bacterium]
MANPLAFHARQAVEKYLKAFPTWHQVPFPKTHDIERLLVLVESVDNALAETAVLTMYGVEARYPGDRAEASEQDALDGLALMRTAREILRAALPLDSD